MPYGQRAFFIGDDLESSGGRLAHLIKDLDPTVSGAYLAKESTNSRKKF